MSKPERSPRAVFLNQVRQQLNRLEPLERREILDELATHLQDAVARHEAVGLATEAAEAHAVQAMGDPTTIGERLRAEHLNGRLSLPAALLCILPLAAIALLFRQTDLFMMLRNFGASNSGFPFSFLLTLTPILALSFGLLARTRQSWPATLLGGTGMLFLIGLVHGLRGVQHGLALALIALLLLVGIPLVLGFMLYWGHFRATLALLGGVGAYGCYAWLASAGPLATFALSLCPLIGVLALGLVPRRQGWWLAWVAFALNWALILVYSFHVANQTLVPGLSLGASDFISPAFLVASAALLLAVQGIAQLQSAGRLTIMDHWVSGRT